MTVGGATVEFEKIRKTYGDFVAVDDFTLTTEPGEFVTLLGPSGSGKTTVLNMLAGFTDATAGDIRVNGQSVLSVPTEKRNVGMVFQHYSLFPHMSVLDNVAFPLRMRSVARAEARDRALKALAMVQLESTADRMPDQLSGGQKQRVAFARGVVFEPPVLLMDEPLGALDLKLREAMQLELKQIHKTVGCTIIFVTHDQSEALTLSDRIVVMRDGRIEQVDTPNRIYDRPANKFVAEFIGQTNFFALESEPSTGAGNLPELGSSIPLPESIDARAGGDWWVSVRPEKILRIAEGAERGINFDAAIDEALFLGNEVHYQASLPGGRQLQFREQRGPDTPLLARQAAVRLGFDYSDAIPVADTHPASA